MAEIISSNKTVGLSENLKRQGKSIVLVGGCFDILHPGHTTFLERAKKEGDILIVLLESDQKVKELKGINRPVHTQKERAKVLSALRAVDYIVMLPYMKSDTEYDELVSKIRPDVIAITKCYANIYHHERAAKKIGAKLQTVTKIVDNHSTSRILNHAEI